MLNVTSIRGNNQYAAAHYFSSADDYYGKENPGEWQGKGAETLGLVGAVDQNELSRLLNGQLPNGERIQATFNKEDNKKRMGLDLTFSAPKSVSMQALVAGDKEVTKAHDRAVSRALEQIEQLAVARKKVNGKSYHERTGNMVIGKFRHEMSRAKDPQLHTHAVVMNMTQREDGKWRALSNEEIYRVQHEIDAVYKIELAKELQGLGYEIRLLNNEGSFELGHISRDQIEAFSGRSQVIEEALANEGKTRATATTLEKQVIALATRERKDEGDREVVKQWWIEKSRELGIDYGARSMADDRSYEVGESLPGRVNSLDAANLPTNLTPAQAVVQYAINHLTEREAVVSESKLTTSALRRAVGLAGMAEVKGEIERLVKQGTLIEAPPTYRLSEDKGEGKALSADGWKVYLKERKGWTNKQSNQYVKTAIKQGSLVAADKRFTTQKALKREQAILAIERDGRGKVMAIVPVATVKLELENSKLNPGQRAAVETILSTSNRFTGIQGDAGTGKTFTVNTAVEMVAKAEAMLEQQGWRTIALAPYGNQVKALKSEGLDAHTLASFINTKDKRIDDKTLILLDEAGVVPARQMEQIMKIVERAGARMVMIGDTKQTEAIEDGKPFAQLQEAGMQLARITEVQRQKTPELKKAVEYAAEGNVLKSIEHIKHIEELADPTERRTAVVTDYMKLTEGERRETLIIAGTNEARLELNALVRDSLGLAGNGKMFDTLSRVDMTQAERRFAPSYQPGMVIQPEKDYKQSGLVRGEIYTVKEALPGNNLVLEKSDKTTVSINPRSVTRLSVYDKKQSELAIGDTIRINRNDAAKDLTNGDRMRVAGVGGKIVRLESFEQRDGKALRSIDLPATKPLHLEHAYASTVHSSQGLTTDRVLIDLSTKSRTTSMNLYYVAISRARHDSRIYTNSRQELPGAIAKRYDKTTALAVQREREMHRQQKQGITGGMAKALKTPQLEREQKAKKPTDNYGRFS